MKYVILSILLSGIAFAIAEGTDMSDYIEVDILPIMEFRVIGMEYTGNDPSEIMALWEVFVSRVIEITGCAEEDDAYGVTLGYDEDSGEFSYLACVASDMTGPVPEGMMELTIPSGTYAVFTFQFDKLDFIYDFAYNEWIPQSGFTHGSGFDFEFYPEDFIPSENGLLMQLYVSVEEVSTVEIDN